MFSNVTCIEIKNKWKQIHYPDESLFKQKVTENKFQSPCSETVFRNRSKPANVLPDACTEHQIFRHSCK